MRKLACMLIFLSWMFSMAPDASAQCAMCRRNVESNKDSRNNKVGTGLNKGILYLMSVPYVIGAIGLAVWMKRRKQS